MTEESGMEKRRAALLLPLLLLALAGSGVLVLVRNRSREAAVGALEQAASQASAPRTGSPVGDPKGASGTTRALVPGSPPPADPQAQKKSFIRLLITSKGLAVDELSRILKSKGGAAALEHVRAVLSRPDPDMPARLKGIYMARLIPWIATEDPSVLPAALDLSRTLLQSKDDWVRFQTLAGLVGAPSVRPGVMSSPDGSDLRFWFNLDRPNPKEVLPAEQEFRKGLLSSVLADPSFRPIIGSALTGDACPEVRVAAAHCLGAIPSPESEPLLATALADDESQEVRLQAMEALGKIGAASFPPRLMQLASDQDELPVIRVAALKQLAQSGPLTAESESLVSGALNSENFKGQRAAVVDAAFDVQGRSPSSSIGSVLVSVFGQNAENRAVLDVFVDRAVRDGRAEYVPLFQALQAASTDPGIRDLMTSGIRDLQGRDAYLAREQELRDLTASVRTLWAEFTNPATAAPRRNELAGQINSLMTQVNSRQGQK